MTVFVATFVDQTFDKKSSEVAYIAKVLRKMADDVQKSQGASSAATNVLECNQAGTPNTAVAQWTYTASASNP
jgi:flagellar hook-basal body complex protein FliE